MAGTSRAARAVLLLASGLWLGGCRTPPDLDGDPAGAQRLPLGSPHRDTLECREGLRPRNDCADWYRVEVAEPGRLSVGVAPHGESAPPQGFAVQLLDDSGLLVEAASEGEQPVALEREVGPAAYLVAVQPRAQRGPLGYRISAELTPPPPPPPPPPEPQLEVHTSDVLEVEGGWGTEARAVLIESGQAQGMQPGLRGRLVSGEAEIGVVVIEQVFPEGSRARIEGPLSAPVTPGTVVRFEIPAGPASAEPPGESP